mgnify:CR=1 FL=1
MTEAIEVRLEDQNEIWKLMKTLNTNNRAFDLQLDNLLLRRKNKVRSETVSVVNIIKDVKKMVIKQYINMKKNLIRIRSFLHLQHK